MTDLIAIATECRWHDGGEREMAECVGKKCMRNGKIYWEKKALIDMARQKIILKHVTINRTHKPQQQHNGSWGKKLNSGQCYVVYTYSNNYLFHISDCMRGSGGLASERKEHSAYNDFDCVVASTELGIWQVNGNERNRTLGPAKTDAQQIGCHSIETM